MEHMDKKTLIRVIDSAMHRVPADLVIYNCHGAYAAPGLIDGHIHIESTYTSPEEFGRMVVPRGTTTVIADPHEITNVYGLEGLNYMIRAASKTELSVRYMIPSCVPATPFEDAGAVVNAFDMQWPMQDRHVPGLGEFMNVPGILEKNDDDLNKLLVALSMHKVIDGHSPGLEGAGLNAYIAAGVKTAARRVRVPRSGESDSGHHALQLQTADSLLR